MQSILLFKVRDYQLDVLQYGGVLDIVTLHRIPIGLPLFGSVYDESLPVQSQRFEIESTLHEILSKNNKNEKRTNTNWLRFGSL